MSGTLYVICKKTAKIYIPYEHVMGSVSGSYTFGPGQTPTMLVYSPSSVNGIAWVPIYDTMNMIEDNLKSSRTNKMLSANQGKILNDTKVNISDIVNNLTSSDTNKPLSANQGKILYNLLSSLGEQKLSFESFIGSDTVSQSQLKNNCIHFFFGSMISKNWSPYDSDTLFSGILLDIYQSRILYSFVFDANICYYSPKIYVSTYNDGMYAEWVEVSGNDDAITISTFKSNIQQYGADPVRVLKSGNIVNIQGAVKNTVALGSNGSYDAIPLFTIPNKSCYPKQSIRSLQQGSGSNTFCLSVDYKGNVSMERYGTNSVIQIPANSWLNINMTYIVD